MRFTLAVVTLAVGLGLCQNSQAFNSVPRDYPDNSEAAMLTGTSRLPDTISIYQNEIVILATLPESHEVKATKLPINASLVKSITSNSGSPVTAAGITKALQQMLKNNSTAVIPATVAALKVAKDAGIPGDAQISIVAAALQSLKLGNKTYMDDAAVLIGFAVAVASEEHRNDVLRQLRDFAIYKSGTTEQADFTLALDKALVEYHVAEVKHGGDDFMAAVATLFPEGSLGEISQEAFDLSNALFQIENGVYSPADGALLVGPFTGGASGTFGNPSPGAFNNGSGPTPPTPPTPPNPAPTPTPTPTPIPPPNPAS